MVLKPFETSLSIVYKGKGEVKAKAVKKKGQNHANQISKFQNEAWLVEPRLAMACTHSGF